MKAGAEFQTFQRLVYEESLADESQHGHLSRRPIDEVLTLGREFQVLDVIAFRADLHLTLLSSVNELTDNLDPVQPATASQKAQLDEDVNPQHNTA